MIDKTIGHYRIIERLGTGGMGEVYVAEDTVLGRRVAIKTLTFKPGQSEQHFRTRFLREARAVSALSHPHIATIYDYGETKDGQPYIVTELVKGETLRERLWRAPLKFSEIIEIAGQIAAALSAAHRVGVIHRDIKPDNVMINLRGEVKLLDFGIAKVFHPPGIDDADAITLLTDEDEIVVGTPVYMSPEQALGEDVDTRTDIWSLGVLLYEMATGRLPWTGSTRLKLLTSVIRNDPAPISPPLLDTPIAFERVLTKALQKKPSDRYQTAEELQDDLTRLHQQLTDADAPDLPRRYALPEHTTEGEPLYLSTQFTRTSEFFRLRRNVFAVALAVLIIPPVLLFFMLGYRALPPSVSSAGDAPKVELASAEMREAIENEVNKLEAGQILFNPAADMKVGVVETIDVRIATSLADELNKGLSGLKGRGRPEIDQIQISPLMGVKLSGTEGFFNIELKNREEKIVTTNKYTEWIFNVTPLREGNPSLYFTAYNVIVTPSGEKGYERLPIARQIKVTKPLGFAISSFLTTNWKELAGFVIASGVLGWVANTIRKRKRKKPPPWEYS